MILMINAPLVTTVDMEKGYQGLIELMTMSQNIVYLGKGVQQDQLRLKVVLLALINTTHTKTTVLLVQLAFTVTEGHLTTPNIHVRKATTVHKAHNTKSNTHVPQVNTTLRKEQRILKTVCNVRQACTVKVQA